MLEEGEEVGMRETVSYAQALCLSLQKDIQVDMSIFASHPQRLVLDTRFKCHFCETSIFSGKNCPV